MIAPGEARRQLGHLRDFGLYARAYWRLYDKQGVELAFRLNPAQARLEAVIREQQAAGEPVRLRVLKYRQAGISTWATARMQHHVQTHRGSTALSIADKMDLPAQWLRRARTWHEQTPEALRPTAGATNANELWFKALQSRYYIGSAEGTTPGMGATIQCIHCSECASWRDPDSVLADLLPALPPGPRTAVIQESTGRSVGDWWHQRYLEAKAGEGGYRAIFLPWWIQPEYRRDPGEVLEVTEDERALTAAGCDKAQLAWRRWMIATEFHGDEQVFANQFPSTEEEAFLAGGLSVFTPEQVRLARETVREPVWRGDLLPKPNPSEYALEGNESGGLVVWEQPDERYKYVVGADVQWGVKDTADFDAAYVECLDTGRVVAALHGHWDMGRYACLLAALGHHYNAAVLAPERNSQAASGVVAVLRGLAGNDWAYPNVWIRSGDLKLRDHRAEDYGWLTNEHTKAEIIAFAKEQTLAGGFDWADGSCVDEMAAYIRDEKGRLTAPEGAHDDRLMARMITANVAHRVRARVDLWKAAEPFVPQFNSMADRVRAQWGEDDEGFKEV